MTSPNDEHIPGRRRVGQGGDGAVPGSSCKSMRGDEVLFQNSNISSGPAVSGDAVPVRSNNVPSEQTAENRSLERGNGSQGGGSVWHVDVVTTNVTKSQGSEKGVASHTMTGDNAVKTGETKRGASEADGNETYKRVEIGSTEKFDCDAIGK